MTQMEKDTTRDHRFTMVMSAEDRAKLDALAAADRRSAADWVRLAISDAYEARFGSKRAKK